MLNILSDCDLCPRNCHVDRFSHTGYCNSTNEIKLSKAYLHMWEEPCISGSNGSGCLFFSNCNLSCIFCQNYEISQNSKGRLVSIDQLSNLMLKLQKNGAHNINLVTPTQYVPQICKAIILAKKLGLSIPIVYNTNSYESTKTIQMIAPLVDIFLADFKYFDDKYAREYSNAPDYFNVASAAIKTMYDYVGNPIFDLDSKLMKKGLIIRHLMLPGHGLDTKNIINYLFESYGSNFYLSLMNQYTPYYKALNHPKLNKPLSQNRYEKMIDYCSSLGLENVFIQDKGSSSDSFIPNFDNPNF